ncbi:hypothetical protein GEO20_15925 [Rhodococcus erythropolis]|uniref:hypothetical protein n=1 Tax=Rhodococcus erythropolis TaxID=1833 RepID=UPI001292AEA1|nr:hypothetical protein [Rhodococcus erythropolis]MQP33456.1 hypothetical protein [Rhodococcus erythropolis]
MNEQSEHEMWVNRLSDAAKGGWIVDLRFGAPARQYNPATADQWPADRRIPASALRTVLLGDHTGFDPRGLRIAGARITGDVDLAHITFNYPLHMVRCRIDQPINLYAATLRALNLTASHIQSLFLDGATITGGLFAKQITSRGAIRAIGATIGGQLNLTGARLNNPGAEVLTLDGATITGAVFAGQIATHGEIRAIGATIDGQLNLTGAHLNNPGKIVLTINKTSIAVGIFADQITTHGEIRANMATIGGQINLKGAYLNNPGKNVVTLDGANMTGAVFRDFVTATTSLKFQANGIITAVRARFAGEVDLTSAKPIFSGHLGVNFDGAVIQQLSLPSDSLNGIFLPQVTITHLATPIGREPRYRVWARGWTIGDIDGLIRTDHAAATRWLDLINKKDQKDQKKDKSKGTDRRPQPLDVSPQPWHALAAVYERNGHPAEARRLRSTAANKVTKNAPLPTKTLRTIYLAVAGHGYYPLLAAVWLIVALIAGVALVETNRAHFVPTAPVVVASSVTAGATGGNKATPTAQTEKQPVTVTGAEDCASHPAYPCLDAFTYALTGVIPAATGITRPDWAVSTTAPAWVKLGIPALRILAWIFTAILLAGVTGLLRKSS